MRQRIAVIVLAYLGSPKGVLRLASYFAVMDAHLFVHVDAKTSLDSYHELATFPNVTIMSKRHEIFWGGFNTVLSIIDAINCAKLHGAYSRFAVITEDSLPIVEPKTMITQMASDTEWIEINPGNQGWILERYSNFYCYDSRATNPRHFPAREMVFDKTLLQRLERLKVVMLRGKSKLDQLYIGPGWWALSAAAIDVILQRHQADLELRESFEFSAIPEEHYFHTILAQAKWDRPRSAFMYADFSRNPKPFKYTTIDELLQVKDNCQRPFMRKVDISSESLDNYMLTIMPQT